MDLILSIPLEIRLAVLVVIGAWVGGQLNRFIYFLTQQPVSPWSTPPKGAPPRKWIDRVPIIGWLYLRREAAAHEKESELYDKGFWVRPLMIELLTGIAFAFLYHWEISGALLPSMRAVALAGPLMLHAQFFGHVVLMCLLIVATFVDFDVRLIPDHITVPGTLFALLLVCLLPQANLPVGIPPPPSPPAAIGYLEATSPYPMAANLQGGTGLAIGLGIFVLWVVALIDYVWVKRVGWKKRFVYLFASIVKYKTQLIVAPLVLLFGAALILTSWFLGGPRWNAVISALIGLAGGGGLVLMVRVIATHALGREAMGFGDVTLMAMVGSFVGWQPAVMIFFMAPVIGILLVVVRAIITREAEFAFGPYLCAATAAMVLFWNPIWNGYAWEIFAFGGMFVPLVLVVCVTLTGVMLMIWQWIKRIAIGSEA